MSKNTKIGDIFEAKLDDKKKKYLQFVASDLTQLNSDVIRVFKKTYNLNEYPDLSDVVKDEIEFYAHCVTKWGIKLGFWEKVGNIREIGKVDMVFKSPGEYDLLSNISYNWWIWRINEDQIYVGRLNGENCKAEIGDVIPPDSIVYRMSNGKYDFVYPAYV